jgi:hypothetical protein
MKSVFRYALPLGLLLALAADARFLSAEETKPAGVDASTMAQANNPLADMNAINLQNYYLPSLYGVPDQTSNTLNLRGIMVTGRHIIRATLPVSTVPTGATTSTSGLGDLNVFDAIVVTDPDASTMIGVGPLLVAPTHTDDALGAPSTWQAGAAAVVVKPLPKGSLVGGLVTWQTDFAGGDDRIDTNLMTTQVFLTMSMGGGWYLRSSPLAVWDFQNDVYLVPLGLGAGKILPLGGAIVNAFIEPQVTVYHKGQGLPSLQIFAGINFQFPKK